MGNFLLVSNVALWMVVLAQTLFILALFRYIGLLLDRLPAQGPAVGKPAPHRDIVDLAGGRYSLGERSQRNRILIFTSPSCPWCEKMAPHIAPFLDSIGPGHEMLVILSDALPSAQAEAYARKLSGGVALDLAVAPELFEAWAVPGTPCGVALDADGFVTAKGTTNTLTDLQTLVKVPATEAWTPAARTE